jgi:hypothetical protein
MTLLDILSQQLVGKRIVSIDGEHTSPVTGATILSVKLHPYEPIFDVGIRHPDGRVATVDILSEWDLEVE